MQTTDYFTGLASTYDANRPSYPLEAIDAALAAAPLHAVIADIGCGTGISTRLLRARLPRDGRVIGIDPNSDMLDAARAAGGDIDYRLGNAESTGLETASVDRIIVAQAFHWFNAHAALHEFHRILNRHGALALIWNVRDDAYDDFTGAYSDIARRSMADARANGFETHELRSADPTVGGCFVEARRHVFANPHRLTREGLIGRARSASYFPRDGNPLRAQLEHELHALFAEHQRDGMVTLMHRTEVTIALPVQ